MRAGRVRYIELAIAASVVLISVASLIVAVLMGQRQTEVMERTLEAAVWPHVQYGTGNYEPESGSWRIRFLFTNQGVGPARVAWIRLYDSQGGAQINATLGFLAECCAPDEITDPVARRNHVGALFASGELSLFNDAVAERVLAPGEAVALFAIDQPEDGAARAVWDRLNEARYRIRPEICYCSVHEQCWRARLPAYEHTPVEECAPPD